MALPWLMSVVSLSLLHGLTLAETLRRFSTVPADEPTGEVEKGKLLVFFLGDSAYEVRPHASTLL
jgi:hypothetical protein